MHGWDPAKPEDLVEYQRDREIRAAELRIAINRLMGPIRPPEPLPKFTDAIPRVPLPVPQRPFAQLRIFQSTPKSTGAYIKFLKHLPHTFKVFLVAAPTFFFCAALSGQGLVQSIFISLAGVLCASLSLLFFARVVEKSAATVFVRTLDRIRQRPDPLREAVQPILPLPQEMSPEPESSKPVASGDRSGFILSQSKRIGAGIYGIIVALSVLTVIFGLPFWLVGRVGFLLGATTPDEGFGMTIIFGAMLTFVGLTLALPAALIIFALIDWQKSRKIAKNETRRQKRLLASRAKPLFPSPPLNFEAHLYKNGQVIKEVPFLERGMYVNKTRFYWEPKGEFFEPNDFLKTLLMWAILRVNEGADVQDVQETVAHQEIFSGFAKASRDPVANRAVPIRLFR